MNYWRIWRRLSEDSYLKDQGDSRASPKGAYLMSIGTKDGKVIVYRIGTNSPYTTTKLLESKASNAYGGISSIDVVYSPSTD
jgi:hypothetical protein